MNKKKLTLLMLVACALLTVYSLPAAADHGSVYLAQDFGRSHFSGGVLDGGGFGFDPSGTSSLKATSSADRFTLGYQITPYFGIEGGYVDLGTGMLSFRGKPVMGFTDTGTYYIHDDGVFVAGTGTWPISEQWSLYAHAGTFSNTLNYNFRCNNSDCALFSSQQYPKSSTTYGVGMKWSFLPHWSLRLGWDRYPNLGEGFQSYRASLLTLGVEWHIPVDQLAQSDQ
jgi:OmpA-OmpF porin, OOP family